MYIGNEILYYFMFKCVNWLVNLYRIVYCRYGGEFDNIIEVYCYVLVCFGFYFVIMNKVMCNVFRIEVILMK